MIPPGPKVGFWNETKGKLKHAHLKQDKLKLMKARPMHAAVLVLLVGLSAGAQTAPKITTSKEALGFNLGDDYQVANYTQLEAYWKKLATESDRMKLVDIGPTAKGGASTWRLSLRRKSEEAGSLQGDFAPAGAGRGDDGRSGPRAGPRGQSRGVD